MTNPFYSVKDDQYIIIFNANRTGDMIRFRYEKLPTLMVDASDTVTINNDLFAIGTIPYLAVAEMFYNRGEESRAAEIINFAL
jgi:hypothetical protein